MRFIKQVGQAGQTTYTIEMTEKVVLSILTMTMTMITWAI